LPPFYWAKLTMFHTDDEGFLTHPADWTREFALQAAHSDHIELTPAHWELIEATRQFYAEYGFSPSMRPLVKYIGMQLEPAKGRSVYLMQLFPPSPAKLLSKFAGLHKPQNCL
jgi:tRNA 2-thiouridine synthesizing protein E